jgi:DNA modification methylase
MMGYLNTMETNKIYNMDALEGLKQLEDKSIDIIITDPPYGINADKGVGGFGSSPKTAKHYEDNWDNQTPTKEVFDEMLRVAKKVFIFGGNFFTDKLPVGKSWIVWDKTGEIKFDNPFSDCELIWTNLDKCSIKKIIAIQQGFIKDKELNNQRYHPTQKPTKIIREILKNCEGDIVLDCFMGSGTTAKMAILNKRNWIGSEISEEYCKILERRITFAST